MSSTIKRHLIFRSSLVRKSHRKLEILRSHLIEHDIQEPVLETPLPCTKLIPVLHQP